MRTKGRTVLVFIALVGSTGCGGTVAGDDAQDAASGTTGDDAGSGSRGDASSTDAASLSAKCPSSPPLFGSPCAPAGLSCEYGGQGPLLLCSTMFTCGDDGAWRSNASGGECTGAQSDDDPSCPATYDALPSGSACPSQASGGGHAVRCVYDQGECGCVGCGLPDGGNVDGPRWSCVPWPAPAGCPTPRPRAGSPCETEGQTCDYGQVCTPVNAGLPDLKCVGGVWQSVPVPVPPCALPVCGR